MTEREKMLAGELYLGNDPELVTMRRHARALVRAHEAAATDEERARILRELFASVGERADIEPPIRVDYGCHITIGDRFFANFGCVLLDCAHIVIGDDVQLAPNVMILTATHPVDAFERAKGPELARPITIGNRVWLGAGAIVLPGISIGDNTTIGAGSVVTRDIPPNVVAAGNPCRVIRQLG